MIISLLAENDSGSTPTTEELASWADDYGISTPVVADDGWTITYRFATGSSIGLPTLHLIGPGAEVIAVDSTSEGWYAETEIESLLYGE